MFTKAFSHSGLSQFVLLTYYFNAEVKYLSYILDINVPLTYFNSSHTKTFVYFQLNSQSTD